MRRTLKVAVALAATAAATFTSGGIANAGGVAAPKATGGISMDGGYLQYASFSAFATQPAKGSITYTNFDVSAPGSGVWTLGSTVPIDLNIGGIYSHVMTVTSLTATGPSTLQFTATGVYSNPDYTWVGSGLVSGNTFGLDLTYTGANPGYTLHLTGTIAPDGSVTGSETGDSVGTFSTPTGSAHEVLSYTASVTCAVVNGASARFGFTIPESAPAGLAGLPIVADVTDGGSPGVGNDTWAHGQGNATTCSGTTNNYPITGGNLVVH